MLGDVVENKEREPEKLEKTHAFLDKLAEIELQSFAQLSPNPID